MSESTRMKVFRPSDFADQHGFHNRTGASTAWVSACWKCAEEWLTYVQAHPDEAPPEGTTIALAIKPNNRELVLNEWTGRRMTKREVIWARLTLANLRYWLVAVVKRLGIR